MLALDSKLQLGYYVWCSLSTYSNRRQMAAQRITTFSSRGIFQVLRMIIIVSRNHIAFYEQYNSPSVQPNGLLVWFVFPTPGGSDPGNH